MNENLHKRGVLKVGDTIKCANADDMINTMTELAKEDIEIDFMYEKDGEQGFFLEVLKVNRRLDNWVIKILEKQKR